MGSIDSNDFLLVFLTSAGLILFGAAYACCHALSILRCSSKFRVLGLTAYVGLLLCLTTLSLSAHFDGLWLFLSLLLAAGYFWMPRVMLKLIITTHTE